jgi:hypothetical protein
MAFRARMAASIITLPLVVFVFVAARAWFGMGAAFLALGLMAFDPMLLAHGAVVTTDAAQSTRSPRSTRSTATRKRRRRGVSWLPVSL